MSNDWRSSPFLGALLLSASVHAVPVVKAIKELGEARAFLRDARATVHDFLWTNYEIEVEKQPPKPEVEKPKEPDPEPEAPAPPPPPKPVAQAPKPSPDKTPEKPAAAAAQAAQVLTAKSDPSPNDIADFTMVQGDAGTYAGGVTASDGTSTDAVRNRGGRGDGVQGGRGTGPGQGQVGAAQEGPDLTRAATSVSRDWNCSHLFPPEADADDINEATVQIVVSVRADGTAQSVKVLSDPGHGFGRAARSCALSQRYNAAFDRGGQAIAGTTTPIRVRFTR